MRKKLLIAFVFFGIGCFFVFPFFKAENKISSLTNSCFNFEGPLKIPALNVERVFSYGFSKTTWLWEFALRLDVKQDLEETLWKDVVADYLVHCAKEIGSKKYSKDTYLSSANPCFYKFSLDATDQKHKEQGNWNCLLIKNGIVTRAKGKDICDEQEKIALGNRSYGVVWTKSLREFLAETTVDCSSLKFDDKLVFNFSNDEGTRSAALQEINRIHAVLKTKGYGRLGDRLLKTGLRNRDEIREWFFEYNYPVTLDPSEQLNQNSVDALKRKWIEVASLILHELNTSNALAPYRKTPWDVRSLRLNLSFEDFKERIKTEQVIFISWSHFVIEQISYNGTAGIRDRKAVRIPLEEFYAWAEAELEKLNETDVTKSPSYL